MTEPCDDPRGHDWQEVYGDCELCGVESHEGLFCPRCYEAIDLVFELDPRNPGETE